METRSAFRVFWICGLIVDLDHALSLTLWATKYPSLDEGRILHTPILIAACVFICCLCAYLGRLYIKLVLRRKKKWRKEA